MSFNCEGYNSFTSALSTSNITKTSPQAYHNSTSSQVPLAYVDPNVRTKIEGESSHSTFGEINGLSASPGLYKGLTANNTKEPKEAWKRDFEQIETVWEEEPEEEPEEEKPLDEQEASDELKKEHDRLLRELEKADSKLIGYILNDYREYLVEFYKKFPKRSDRLKIDIACVLIMMGESLKEIQSHLKGVQNPDKTNETEENVDCQRILYLLQAVVSITQNNLEEAKGWLLKCCNVPQEYFEKKEEDYLDYYAAYMGVICAKEKKYKEAQKWFEDALVLRKRMGHPRLISLSYNDLALLYVEMGKALNGRGDNYKRKALGYLKQAEKYENEFLEKMKDSTVMLLIGQVDYRRVNLITTVEKLEAIRMEEMDINVIG